MNFSTIKFTANSEQITGTGWVTWILVSYVRFDFGRGYGSLPDPANFFMAKYAEALAV